MWWHQGSTRQLCGQLTGLLIGDVHLAAAQRGGHLGGGQCAITILVKLIEYVAERVRVGARGNALARQQLQGEAGPGASAAEVLASRGQAAERKTYENAL